MKVAQEVKLGKEKQIYYVFRNIHISKNINSVSKENQQRPLQPMKCCATITNIFIAKVSNKTLSAIGNPFYDS